MFFKIELGDREELIVGIGGWVNYQARFASGYDEPQVWLRFENPSGRRLRATELHTMNLSPAGLREIPLGRIEAAVNEEAVRAELSLRIERDGARAGEPRFLLGELAPTRKEIGDRALTKFESALAPFLGIEATLLARPKAGERGPDGFYREIGANYERLAATTGKPAVNLARLAGVSVSTVHRWVKEARRRGLMAPGRRG